MIIEQLDLLFDTLLEKREINERFLKKIHIRTLNCDRSPLIRDVGYVKFS